MAGRFYSILVLLLLLNLSGANLESAAQVVAPKGKTDASKVTWKSEVDDSILDRRVTSSMTYSQLVPRSYQALSSGKRTDNDERWSRHSSDVGGLESTRAGNLAASGHYAEAIDQYTEAIEVAKKNQRGHHVADWFFQRSLLYEKLGLSDRAIQDLVDASRVPIAGEPARFKIALALINHGKYVEAESLLKDCVKSGFSLFRSYHYYLLGYSQEKENQFAAAADSYRKAATLFSASGVTPPAEAALDAFNRVEKADPGLSMKDLKPPASNLPSMQKLVTALVTSKEVFNLDQLKELCGVSGFSESKEAFWPARQREQFPEIRSIRIEKLKTGGKKLVVDLDTILCCVNRETIEPFLKDSISVEQNFRADYGHIEGYRVPSGTVLITLLNGGFKSIKYLELYSLDASYPPPKRISTNQSGSGAGQVSTRMSRVNQITRFRRDGNFKTAEMVADEWIKAEPSSSVPYIRKAELKAQQNDYDGAVATIDEALKAGVEDANSKNRYHGNLFLIMKGSYLLELKRFKEALECLERGFPERLSPENLVLAARAEIGVGRYEDAEADLKEAMKEFFRSARIIKRDECQALLDSLKDKLPSDGADTAVTSEKEKALFYSQRSLVKKAKERQENELRLARARMAVKLTGMNRARSPLEFIRSVAALLREEQRLGVKESVGQDRDKYIAGAVESYSFYQPAEEYNDQCLGTLVLMLNSLDEDSYKIQLEKLLNLSERSFKEKSYRHRRDQCFISNSSRKPDDKVSLIKKMIEVRKSHQNETGADCASLYRELGWKLKGNGDRVGAENAFKSAVAEKLGSKKQSIYLINLAIFYTDNVEFAKARKAWKEAAEVESWKLSKGTASSLASLSKRLRDRGDNAGSKEILEEVLKHPNKNVIEEFDPVFRKRVEQLKESNKNNSAETFLKRVIAACRRCDLPESLIDWQMQLSQLCLLSGKKDLSESLYLEAKDSLKKKGESTDALEIRRRTDLKQAGIKFEEPKQSNSQLFDKVVTFPYALYAFSELSLNGNTMTGSIDSSKATHYHSIITSSQNGGDVASPGKIEVTGNTNIFGTIHGKLSGKATPQLNAWMKIGKTKLDKDCPVLNRQVKLDGTLPRTNLGDYKGGAPLKGGDYEATSLPASVSICENLTRAVRIFITDDSTASKVAAYGPSCDYSDKDPKRLQIYYLGYRPIVFGHNSNVCALVYAPHAEVKMGDNNCDFTGAIIADKITAVGNVTVNYDRALTGYGFVPSKESAELDPPEPPQLNRHERERARKKEREERSRAYEQAKSKRIATLKALVQKYPALARLDIIDGPVIYEEGSGGVRSGGSSDGKVMRINGPNSVVVRGLGDGSHNIVLDGMRLVDIADAKLRAGDLKRAEELFTMALRARADSETFGLLGKCWYKMKKLDDAKQACAAALELDSGNKQALSLKKDLGK